MIFSKHNQETATRFIDHLVGRFPFRSKQIRTDRGHEFRAKSLEVLGIHHDYTKPTTPWLNGKVERSLHTDIDEFEHLLIYKDNAIQNGSWPNGKPSTIYSGHPM
jgi:transposase InsO family protein